MQSKGIAVPYIIALILGIVVVGLLGFWFFILGGTFGGQVTAQECNAKKIAYCSLWSAAGYPETGKRPGLNTGTWGTDDWNNFYAKGCSDAQVSVTSKSDCQNLLRQSPVRTGGGTGTAEQILQP